MTDERGVGEATAVDEGAWIYLIDPASDPGAGNVLGKRVAETCEEGGWPP